LVIFKPSPFYLPSPRALREGKISISLKFLPLLPMLWEKGTGDEG